MPSYVAFLRGINVGGNKKVPMADWKKMLGKMGYENVKTLLNSGNAVFETDEKSATKIEKEIAAQMEKTFGFPVPTIVRSIKEIETLIDADPFKGIKVTPETRLYITFLSAKPTSKLKIPYASPEKDMKILKVTDGEVISVLIVSEKKGTVDAMAIIEREFGKNVTTRNWNTVVKLVK